MHMGCIDYDEMYTLKTKQDVLKAYMKFEPTNIEWKIDNDND